MPRPQPADLARVLKEVCACAAHEANRAYCRAFGDDTQPSWVDAPEWQKSSALAGVTEVLVNKRTPEQLHESWMAMKLAEGWTLGPVKDAEKKRHPCLVPYAELSPEQQKKDRVFHDVVTSVAAQLGDGLRSLLGNGS